MLAETKKVLSYFGKSVIAKAKANAPKNTGKLADSLSFELIESKDSIGVNFKGVDYAQFQDQGVRGKLSSAKAPNSPFQFGSGSGGGGLRGGIDKWVIQKNIKGVRDDAGRFVGRKGLVYVISRSIYNTGLRPTMFFTKPFEAERKQLQNKLEKALGKDFERDIKLKIKGTNLIIK